MSALENIRNESNDAVATFGDAKLNYLIRDNLSYSILTKENQCPRARKHPSPQRCRCGVENSSRFSLRVMEAMRSLQRDVDQPSTSTAEEIADYIRSHYRHDGDLYAQVRTALRQVCSQGLVPFVEGQTDRTKRVSLMHLSHVSTHTILTR